MVASRHRLAAYVTLGGSPWLFLLLLASTGQIASTGQAEQLISLRNGLNLRGINLPVATLNENDVSADAGIQNRSIWMIDDGLRRTYVHRRGMVAAEPVEVPDLGLRMEFPQLIPEGGSEVGAIGQVLGVGPFDRYGRRQMRLRGPTGNPMVLHQGIEELTARYAKVVGLKSDRPIRLDMRIATQSLSSKTLREIFRTRLDWNDPDERLEMVRFFIESERFHDARDELQRILNDFPDSEELRPQLAVLAEREATTLIDQAQLRLGSGQTALAEAIFKKFPVDRVSRVTRLRVEDELKKINETNQQITQLIGQLEKLVKELSADEQAQLTAIVKEIQTHLSPNTLPRMSDFVRLGGNQATPVQQRVALAIAGWIIGSGSGESNLKLAISLITVRDTVIEYLAESSPAQRKQILEKLNGLEATRPDVIAKILPLIPPPLSSRSEEMGLATIGDSLIADQSVLGQFRVGLDSESWAKQIKETPKTPLPASYLIQLPPEYDPLKAYPCVVALHAASATPQTQLNWWAGVPSERFLQVENPGTDAKAENEATAEANAAEAGATKSMRLGHGPRHGFIVLTPLWMRPGQRDYEYTTREHDAVLKSLRDAMRRFSIDADRIFIGGHGAGGSGAWDIALAHPDVWAGLISISPEPQKTLLFYSKNGVYVPTYFVVGEKDGRPLKRHGAVYNDYMTYQHDSMVVMYRGRGKEFFFEEIDRIFEWMKTSYHRRGKFPQKIDVATMREGDQFFWWLEWQDSLPDTVIDPILWNEAERITDAKVSAVVGANNEIRINQAPSNSFDVWLSPEMSVDFGEPISVRYRSRRKLFRYEGDIEVMLEDSRTRADRVRPFWGKVRIP